MAVISRASDITMTSSENQHQIFTSWLRQTCSFPNQKTFFSWHFINSFQCMFMSVYINIYTCTYMYIFVNVFFFVNWKISKLKIKCETYPSNLRLKVSCLITYKADCSEIHFFFIFTDHHHHHHHPYSRLAVDVWLTASLHRGQPSLYIYIEQPDPCTPHHIDRETQPENIRDCQSSSSHTPLIRALSHRGFWHLQHRKLMREMIKI